MIRDGACGVTASKRCSKGWGFCGNSGRAHQRGPQPDDREQPWVEEEAGDGAGDLAADAADRERELRADAQRRLGGGGGGRRQQRVAHRQCAAEAAT